MTGAPLYTQLHVYPASRQTLFTVDDGWNRYLEKHGDSVSQWTQLAVERMRACGTCAMGVRRYCCASPDCTHSRFFCQSCKSKACSAGGMKSTEQWIAKQQHVLPDCEWQHITFTMPHLLWVTSAMSASGGVICRRSMAGTGSYLKWSPVSASRLRHYGGSTVVHHYLDHRTGKHKCQTLSQEKMIGRDRVRQGGVNSDPAFRSGNMSVKR
nr:transposase zinc-binding domain-containing protein [Candidatus Erwinia dacicola]